MTWEEKFAAMKALVGDFAISLMMREPGDWYVSVRGRDVGGDGVLVDAYGNGRTPEEAVNADWRCLVEELPPDKFIVVQRQGEPRRHVRWNGYMWQERPR